MPTSPGKSKNIGGRFSNGRCFDALRCADRYSSTCLCVVEVPHLLPEATRTESPKSASELDCRPRPSAARLAPDCPDPPGERIPGVSYSGCSPASHASCSRRSPRGRTSDLGAPREHRVYRCTGSAAGKRGQRSALSFCLSVIVRGSPEPLLGPLTPFALGSLPRARSH